jgi:hypothetical protein
MVGVNQTKMLLIIFFFIETPFYLQSICIHSVNWLEDWVL